MCVCNSVSSSVTPWTVAHQAPLSLGILQARMLVGCHALLQGIFPTQGLNHISWVFCIAGGFFTAESSGKPVT